MDDDGDDNEMRMNLKKSQKFSDKTERLIDWNVDILVRLLQQIIAYRDISSDDDLVVCGQANVSNPFDEVKEIISLPEFKETRKMRDPAEVKIPDDVVGQLRSYVSTIAGLYKENSFHNFEHVRTALSVYNMLRANADK